MNTKPPTEQTSLLDAIINALGKKDDALYKVFPNSPHSSIDKLFENKIVGATKHVDDRKFHRYSQDGYKIFCPLYNTITGKIVSAQVLFCDPQREPPYQTKKGRPIHTLSIAGSYGKGGVTFGEVNKVMNENPARLFIVDSLIDYLFLSSTDHKNLIGMPGNSLLSDVLEYIRTAGYKGRIFSLIEEKNNS